jgi:hypothetical protein
MKGLDVAPKYAFLDGTRAAAAARPTAAGHDRVDGVAGEGPLQDAGCYAGVTPGRTHGATEEVWFPEGVLAGMPWANPDTLASRPTPGPLSSAR